MADAAWHSSGLGAHDRWPLRARRDAERTAVGLGHALICTSVGREGVDSVRAGVLLVTLGGWRRPPCDHAVRSCRSPVRSFSGGATEFSSSTTSVSGSLACGCTLTSR